MKIIAPKPITALILGGGKTVFEDAEKARKLFKPDIILGVNDVIADYAEIQYACSMHPEKMGIWLTKRRENGHPDPKEFWTADTAVKRDHLNLGYKTVRNTRGGSGLLAVYVARALFCKKIVLAGIPMAPEFEHYHTPGAWKEYKLYKLVWEHDKSLLQDVRSMSGWTREAFGAPTKKWFDEA